MENASKALLMAGGVMLTMLVVSILMYGWGTFSEYQTELDRIKEVENVAKFNQQFTNYERNDVQGYELLSLVNKVIDYNQRHSEDGTTTGSVAGNDASYKGIKVYIEMYDGTEITENFVISKLTREIAIPDKESIGGDELTLFTEPSYTQSKTTNTFDTFENKVLSFVRNIEKKDSEFGGVTGIQNLVKNIDTIYQGKIIGHNSGNDVDSSWYDMTYIINRYKTLTGKECDINAIRDPGKVKDVLKYYEYSYFKKSLFKCTRIDYDDGEARRNKFR